MRDTERTRQGAREGTAAQPEWRIRIVGLQRPGRRPERHTRALAVRAATHAAAASQAVLQMLAESAAAGDPLEPGTRVQASVRCTGAEREHRVLVTYEPQQAAAETDGRPQAATPGLTTEDEALDYYVRLRSQRCGNDPALPLEWACDQRAHGPQEAAKRAVATFRTHMPGLRDRKGQTTVYAVETIVRGDRHRPFEGWEIEVTVAGDGTPSTPAPSEPYRRVH